MSRLRIWCFSLKKYWRLLNGAQRDGQCGQLKNRIVILFVIGFSVYSKEIKKEGKRERRKDRNEGGREGGGERERSKKRKKKNEIGCLLLQEKFVW